MIKTILKLLAVAALVAAAVLITLHVVRTEPPAGPSFTHSPVVTELEKLNKLVTVKVHVSDVLEGYQANTWGAIRGAWLVKGDALLAVDMSKAAVVARDDAAKTLTLSLPAPHVESARVDHEKTRTYDVTVGLLRPLSAADQMRDDAMRQAQALVQSVAGSGEYIDFARERTEAALQSHFEAVGWKAVIRWQDRTATTGKRPD